MTLGIIIILIVIFGFISNWLNREYLNYKITHYLYYIGAFVHESSHAIACILTGAKIEEFSVFSEQPHVTHKNSKIPVIGNIFISLAPIIGGILFLYFFNYFFPSGNFEIIKSISSIEEILKLPIEIIREIDLFTLNGILMLLLLINSGAMIGPSTQDIKNIWFVFIPLIFLNVNILNNLCFTALIIILANIYIQILLIFTVKLLSLIKK